MRACIAPSSASSLRLPPANIPETSLTSSSISRAAFAPPCSCAARTSIPLLPRRYSGVVFRASASFFYNVVFCRFSSAQLVILNCPRSNRDFFCKSGLCQVGFHSLFSQPVFESHKAPLSKIFCEHEQNFRPSYRREHDVRVIPYLHEISVRNYDTTRTVCVSTFLAKFVSETGNFFLGTEDAYEQFTMRTLPLVPFMRERLLTLKEEQQENRRLCGRSYIKDYLEYVCVNEIGDLIKPHYVTESFPKLLKAKGMRQIRYHDLRHSCASLLRGNALTFDNV